MKLRVMMALVLFALAFQGSVSAYASTAGALAGKTAGTASCSASDLSAVDGCDCCSNQAGSCCSVTCLLSIGAGLPTDTRLQTPRVELAAIPDRAVVLFVGHDPPRPLRPPIV